LILPVGRKLPKSGLYIPESATANRDLDWRRPRTIWTADGEIQVPTKRRPSRGRYQSVLRARVRAIWVRDERGQLIVWDPHGSLNTITGGAGWNILNALFGWSGMPNYGGPLEPGYSGISGTNAAVTGPQYYDGTYYFPSLTQIGNFYNGTNTYYLGWDQVRPYVTLFGQIWYLHGASGGLTGSHIGAAVTPQMAHSNSPADFISQNNVFSGAWLQNNAAAYPTNEALSPDTQSTDTVSSSTSGTPYIEHSITVSTTTSAQSVTFDSVAWVPIVGLGASSGTSESLYGARSYWAAGSPVTTAPTWASGSTTPSSISNLQVSALWVIGFAVTLSPGQSFGYTYTFQG